jgi:hypothetical protein
MVVLYLGEVKELFIMPYCSINKVLIFDFQRHCNNFPYTLEEKKAMRKNRSKIIDKRGLFETLSDSMNKVDAGIRGH